MTFFKSQGMECILEERYSYVSQTCKFYVQKINYKKNCDHVSNTNPSSIKTVTMTIFTNSVNKYYKIINYSFGLPSNKSFLTTLKPLDAWVRHINDILLLKIKNNKLQ